MLPLEDTQHPTDTGSRREGWGVTSPMRTVGFSFLFFKMLAVHLNPHTLSMDVIQPGSSGMLSRLPVLQPAKLCGQPWVLLGEAAWFRRGLEAFWKSLNLFYDVLTNSMKGCTPSQNILNFRGGGWRRVGRDRRLKCITLNQSHSDGL